MVRFELRLFVGEIGFYGQNVKPISKFGLDSSEVLNGFIVFPRLTG